MPPGRACSTIDSEFEILASSVGKPFAQLQRLLPVSYLGYFVVSSRAEYLIARRTPTSTPPVFYGRARDIVLAALAIDDEAARRAYVDTACAGDTNLAARVNSLIECATEDKANIGLSDAMQSKKADDAGVAATQVNIASDARAQSDSKAIEFAESAEGETLFERYQIERILGRGGMGVVYLAKDLRLERMVAPKIPRFDKEQKQLIERFHREGAYDGISAASESVPDF